MLTLFFYTFFVGQKRYSFSISVFPLSPYANTASERRTKISPQNPLGSK